MRFGLQPFADEEETVEVTVQIDVFGTPVSTDVAVPTEPVSPRRLLPVVREIAGRVVSHAVARVEKEGKAVSCRAGCAACCWHLVPLAPVEAHEVRDIVAALPEPRRGQVLARFAAAHAKLAAASLLPSLRDRTWEESVRKLDKLSVAYLAQRIPCPFLEEDDSCSIYLDRPLVCREYLVTSAAEHCAHPTPDAIHTVPLPGGFTPPLAALGRPRSRRATPFVPLVLALDYAASHPEPAAERTGPELLAELVGDRRRSGSRSRG